MQSSVWNPQAEWRRGEKEGGEWREVRRRAEEKMRVADIEFFGLRTRVEQGGGWLFSDNNKGFWGVGGRRGRNGGMVIGCMPVFSGVLENWGWEIETGREQGMGGALGNARVSCGNQPAPFRC